MGKQAYGEQFEFTFTRERLEAYKTGAIHPRWFEHYPQLFDEDDRRIVENQHSRGYHFFKMLSAFLFMNPPATSRC